MALSYIQIAVIGCSLLLVLCNAASANNAAVAPQQKKLQKGNNYLRVLNQPVNNNTTTKTKSQIPSAGAGLANIVQHDDSDITRATKSTEPVLYYTLTHDASNSDLVYASVSYNENDLYNTNATIIPCVLGPVDRASMSLAHCMDHAHTIHLNVSIHIMPQTTVMHYTDVHHHVMQIRPSTSIISNNNSSTSEGNEKIDFHSKTAIICFVVFGVLTAVFFTYCTCCCCPNAVDDDDDDDDDHNQAYRKAQAMAMKKKQSKLQHKNRHQDDSSTVASEDEHTIHIKKSSGKYSYQQSDGSTIVNAALNQSLVDVDLSRGPSLSTDRVGV